MLIWAKATLNGFNQDAHQNSPSRQLDAILSHHTTVESPSYRERSYALGWVRTQLPGIMGLIDDNPDYFDLPELPELHAGASSSLLIYH